MVDEDVEPGTTQVEVFENDFQVDQLTQETFEQRAQFIRNALATIFVYVTGLMLLLGTICSFFNLLPSPGRLFLSLAFAISRLLLIALFAHFHPVDASKVTSLFKCIFLAFVLDSLWYWEMTLRAIAIPSPTLIVAYFISLGVSVLKGLSVAAQKISYCNLHFFFF